MKTFFKLTGLLVLFFFSFFYTEKVINVITEQDEIMIKIKENEEKNNIPSTNAIIDKNTITPGLSGKEINIDKSYKEMTMKDIIKDEKSCFIEETEDQDCFIKILDVTLNYLEGKNRLTLLYRMGNVKENEIAEKLHVAWKYVTVIYKKAIRKVRKAMEYNIKYKKVFQIEVVHNKYKISFSPRDIKEIRKICNEILKKETERDFSGIEIAYAKNRVEILMPANFQSFYFMAQVILESDMKK